MRPHLLWLFGLAALATSAQSPAMLDSVEQEINRAAHDTTRADLLVTLYEWTAHQGAMAEQYRDRLFNVFVELERSSEPAVVRKAARVRARYLCAFGSQQTYTSDFSGALKAYMEAWRITENPTDRETLDHYARLQRFYELMGDTTRMVEFARQMLPFAHALKDTASVLLAQLAIAIKEPDHVPIDSLIVLGDRFTKTAHDRGIFNWNIAYLLRARGDQDEAMRWLRNSIAAHGDDPVDLPFALMHWTLAEHYDRMDSVRQGIATIERAIELTKVAKVDAWLGRERTLLGELLIRDERLRDAEQALLQAIEELKATGQVRFEMAATKALKDLYVREGRLADALHITENWVVLKDSVDGMQAVRETAQLEFEAEMRADSLSNAMRMAQEIQRGEARVAQERTRRNIVLFAGLGLLVFGVVVFQQRRRTQKALQRSDELLLNILPEEVAEELKATGAAEAKHFDTATILFTDFKGFTQLSEQVTPAELVAELNTCFKAFDGIMAKYRIEKIKTIGDAYMAAGGLPDPQHGPPADVIRAALEMQDFMKRHKAEREAAGKPYFEMRVGIHTGPVVAGIVGVKKFQYDIWGDTVNTAARMESSGEVGQVNISEATYRSVNGEERMVNGEDGASYSPTPINHSPAFVFTPRGKVQAKGKGEMEMYFVERS
ncbi:MAG: hypothetical protein IPK70_12805 [Flavobacteriales bacterium]|nr:hypothetical protein [Flavobacteriales bacterium]